MWTSPRVENSRELQSSGAPQDCEIYLQELNKVPTVDIREQSPHASSMEREKGTIL